jgi:four helix bundle protein
MADFKNLIVWQRAHQLSIATVESVESIKGNAGSLIRNQVLRSILSIQSNIAEGSSKRSDRDFARYIRIAMGSATESENHFLLLRDLNLIEVTVFDKLDKLLAEVGKMLNKFEQRLSDDADLAY